MITEAISSFNEHADTISLLAQGVTVDVGAVRPFGGEHVELRDLDDRRSQLEELRRSAIALNHSIGVMITALSAIRSAVETQE